MKIGFDELIRWILEIMRSESALCGREKECMGHRVLAALEKEVNDIGQAGNGCSGETGAGR